MKICDEEKEMEAVPGRLYKFIEPGMFYGELHICVEIEHRSGKYRLFGITDGAVWSDSDTFGHQGPSAFRDVTDEWCLKKIGG